MNITATATRSNGWWAITIDVGGGLHTQVRRLDQAEAMIRDALDLVGIKADTITVIPELPTGLDRIVESANRDRAEAERVQSRALASASEAASALTSAGFTVKDTGRLLGISPQRVSQLSH